MTRHDLVVLGGRQRQATGIRELGDDWYGYGSGVVVRVRDGVAEPAGTYVSRPGTHADGDAVLFKSGTVRPGRIHACTQTEIFDLVGPDLRVERHVSLPCFNDVHHVVPTDDGTRLVAVSGTESVLEIADDGTIVHAWHTLGGDPWQVIHEGRDLRFGVNLKPHRSHPNHVFIADGERWATRFEQRDAVNLDDPTRRIDIATERTHDGVLYRGLVYFTTVDATVVVADPLTGAVVSRHDLTRGLRSDESMGWTRALCFDDNGGVWVGFSRIRFTKLRQHLSFLRTGERSRPTRIVRYRLSDWAATDEIDLEPAGCNAVFTIGIWPY